MGGTGRTNRLIKATQLWAIDKGLDTADPAKQLLKVFDDTKDVSLGGMEMKKNVEWLKEEVEKLDKETSQNYPHEETVELPSVLRLIDQLDELGYSSEDMTKYYRDGYKAGIEDEKSISKTKLPVIPGYVAEYIKNEKENGLNLKESLDKLNVYEYQGVLVIRKTADYVSANFDEYVTAYLNGYTVEEKKYQIHFGNHKYAQRFNDKWLSSQITDKEFASTFTKEEIMKLDNSDLYWNNFAEEVAE